MSKGFSIIQLPSILAFVSYTVTSVVNGQTIVDFSSITSNLTYKASFIDQKILDTTIVSQELTELNKSI